MSVLKNARHAAAAQVLVLAAALMALASCQSADDRAWADYSRGLNHVLNK